MIRWLETLSAADAPGVGGKAANLGELLQAGLPVPPGFVLLPGAPEAQEAALAEAYAELARRAGEPEPAVAVRSSAGGEDGAAASFAGQYVTLLNVRGASALAEAVAACRASAEEPRLAAYRAPREPGELAVVVQALVPATCAGVAFGADPVTGEREVILVEAAYGLGEGVVSGQVDPDRAVLETETGALRAFHLGEKAVAAVPSEDGTAWASVPAEYRAAPALGESELAELAELVRRAQAHFGRPLDVEWARADDRFFVLQARPITALPPAPPAGGWPVPGPGHWERANVAEHFPGPLSRLARTLVVPPLMRAVAAMARTVGQRVPEPAFACVHGTLYTRSDWASDWTAPFKMLPAFARLAFRDPSRWERAPGAHAARVAALLAAEPETLEARVAWAEAFVRELAEAWADVHRLSAGWRWSEYVLRRELGGDSLRAGALLGGYPGPAGAFAQALAELSPDAAPAALSALAALGADLPASLDPAVPLPFAAPEALPAQAAGCPPGSPWAPAASRRDALAAEVLAEAPAWRRPWRAWLLRRAQAYAALREPALAELGRGFGAFRARLLALGEALGLAEPASVFELDWDEARAAAAGAGLPDAAALAARLAERKAQEAYMPPAAMGPAAESGGRELLGVPASPGRATGPARVVLGPADFAAFRPGEILIAPATTPAWTPLFGRAAAIVTDVGGPLSHGSIVAREYGVPAVLGVGSATRRVRTGQIVTVEGDTGRVVVER